MLLRGPVAWYFTFYGGLSSLMPYMNLFYKRIGFSNQHIGVLSALRPWVNGLIGPLVALAADRFKVQRRTFLAVSVLTLGIRVLVALPTSFGLQVLLMLLFTSTGASIGSFVDTAVLSQCMSEGEYGRHRLFASIGWGIFAVISGALTSSLDLGIYVTFIIYAILTSLSLIASWYIDFSLVVKRKRIVEPTMSPELSNGLSSDGKATPVIPRKVKGILRNSHSFPELNRLASMHLDRASIALASLPEGAHEGTDGDHEGGGARDHVADVSFSRLRPRDLGRIEEYDGANGNGNGTSNLSLTFPPGNTSRSSLTRTLSNNAVRPGSPHSPASSVTSERKRVRWSDGVEAGRPARPEPSGSSSPRSNTTLSPRSSNPSKNAVSSNLDPNGPRVIPRQGPANNAVASGTASSPRASLRPPAPVQHLPAAPSDTAGPSPTPAAIPSHLTVAPPPPLVPTPAVSSLRPADLTPLTPSSNPSPVDASAVRVRLFESSVELSASPPLPAAPSTMLPGPPLSPPSSPPMPFHAAASDPGIATNHAGDADAPLPTPAPMLASLLSAEPSASVDPRVAGDPASTPPAPAAPGPVDHIVVQVPSAAEQDRLARRSLPVAPPGTDQPVRKKKKRVGFASYGGEGDQMQLLSLGPLPEIPEATGPNAEFEPGPIATEGPRHVRKVSEMSDASVAYYYPDRRGFEGFEISHTKVPTLPRRVVQFRNVRPSRRELLDILRDPSVLLLLLVAFCWGISTGFIENYLFLYLDEMHAPETLMGLCLAVNCIAEIPVFLYSGPILEWLGLRAPFHLVSLAFVLRLFYYYIFHPIFHSAWAVLLAEPLHGITFALGWAAGCERVRQMAPAGWQTTIQQLFTAAWFGLGHGFGGLVGGLFSHKRGLRNLFGIALLVTLVAWGAYFLVEREVLLAKERDDDEEATPLFDRMRKGEGLALKRVSTATLQTQKLRPSDDVAW